MLMKKLLAALVFGAVCASAFAQNGAKAPAPSATEASVRAAVQDRLGQDAKLGAIRRAPAGDLWEVQVGRDVVYSDAQANYLFIGKLIDARSRQDLTQARIDDINRIDFKSLPLDLAMKWVKGKGERVVAVFADPNCGYCKQFERSLNTMDNLTVYTFMLPILAEDSVVKTRQIWCSADPVKTWRAWMIEGKTPMGKAECEVPVAKLSDLGARLGVSATPTLFFPDGTRAAGALPVDQLEARWRGLAKP